jgi:hypothetical protein
MWLQDTLFPAWSLAEIVTFVGCIFNGTIILVSTFLVGLRDA